MLWVDLKGALLRCRLIVVVVVTGEGRVLAGIGRDVASEFPLKESFIIKYKNTVNLVTFQKINLQSLLTRTCRRQIR